MAFAEVSSQNGVNGSSTGLSGVQRLSQKHDESHKATIEDIPDEDDSRHGPQPTTSSVLESTGDAAQLPGWVPPMSTKAAGKQKADFPSGKENQKPLLDTQSDEVFPGLGGAPKFVPAAATAPIWGIKKSKPPASGAANGVATNGSSTPTSGINTPPSATSSSVPRGAPQSLAGQVQGPTVVLQKDEVLPRNQLKKPIPDILKEISKKSRPMVNIAMTTGEKGAMKFSVTGAAPDSAKQQALRDLGAQIGVKVCPL